MHTLGIIAAFISVAAVALEAPKSATVFGIIGLAIILNPF
jgi:hypothetical protein